jgi:transposase
MKVRELVSDELWERIEPPLPPRPPQPKGGHPWNPDRPALGGILSVLRTGIQWQVLPLELGCGSGSTCWRRRRDWQAAGVWHALHRPLLAALGEADAIAWSRARAGSARVPAKQGAGRQARTRRTAAKRARSASLWSTGPAARRRSA